MNYFHSAATAVFLALATLSPGHAADTNPGPHFERVTLDPIEHLDAHLTLTAADGAQVTFTPAELEALGSWRLVTLTPWREEPARFEGALLTEVLAAAHMEDVAAIEVFAENDYAVTIEAEVWQTVPILVATRVNGEAHNRRERGPIQFVMNMDDYTGTDVAAERHWVWMAASIQPAN